MQKFEAIKQARAAGAKRGAEEVDAPAAAAAAAIAEEEVQRPVIQLQKKRRVRGARGWAGVGLCGCWELGLLACGCFGCCECRGTRPGLVLNPLELPPTPSPTQVMDTIAQLEAGEGSSEDDEDGEGGEGGDDLLDWRAKKSAF